MPISHHLQNILKTRNQGVILVDYRNLVAQPSPSKNMFKDFEPCEDALQIKLWKEYQKKVPFVWLKEPI